MLYVMTSNDDRKTPTRSIMWTLEAEHTCIVHLNFRSEGHLSNGGCEGWLRTNGWERNEQMRSAVTSGVPNGPYSGPVFTRTCEPGRTHLYGSNNWEGTYLVFLEIKPADVGERGEA